MKQVNIMRGDAVAGTITLIDPELRVVVMEGVKEPDYSHLIGKWVKCVESDRTGRFFLQNKWYKCVGDPYKELAFIDDKGNRNGFPTHNAVHFDLSNPRDTNPDDMPDEVKIPFDYERWKAGDFIRVETRGGRELKQLIRFDGVLDIKPLHGCFDAQIHSWKDDGMVRFGEETEFDLTLVVKNPDKP